MPLRQSRPVRLPRTERRPRNIRRCLVVLLPILVLAGSVVLVAPAPQAQAAPGYSVVDDLNTNPSQRWTAWNNGSGSNGFSTVGSDTWGWVTKTDTSGWSEIGRNVTLPSWTRQTSYCRAWIDLRASVDGSTSVANVEVINRDDWRYVALSQVSVTGSTWHTYAAAWAPSPTMPLNLRFRVSLLGSGSYRYLGIDDLTLGCWTIA